MKMPIYTAQDLFSNLDRLRRPYQQNYLAMYSSVWEAIVVDPVLMTVPADDHMVHRADAVFDISKCVGGRAYCLRQHLDRLENSARQIGLQMPPEYDQVVEIIRTCVQAGGLRDVIIRLMVSRGPGGFTANPYECPRSELYVFVYKLKTPPPQAYEEGVTIFSAPVPVKPAFFANIKSCAYLHNALTKKAAIEAGADYGVNWDENGLLAEGATENVILVSPEGELLHPGFERVLRGVTLARVLALAENLAAEGLIKTVRMARIDRDLASRAPEVMLVGTSLDVLPVAVWDGRRVGQGRPGPVARRLLAAIRDDIAHNQDFLTPMFD